MSWAGVPAALVDDARRARDRIQRLLARMPTRLNFDVAWVFELADEFRVVGYVDAAVPGGPIR